MLLKKLRANLGITIGYIMQQSQIIQTYARNDHSQNIKCFNPSWSKPFAPHNVV